MRLEFKDFYHTKFRSKFHDFEFLLNDCNLALNKQLIKFLRFLKKIRIYTTEKMIQRIFNSYLSLDSI